MKLEGEIGEINVIERLVELGREGFTGAVRFENDGIIKIIYFKNGDVLSASTNDRADSVDEILLRANKVTREHVKQALAKRKENETLGDALLGLGFITRKELTWARRVQVIGAIRSVAEWGAGTFNVVADYLPKREEGTLFPLTQLIVELVVTDNDRQKFDRALDGGNAVFDRGGDFDEQFARLSLNEDAEQIVGAVDGERNAAEVALASGKDAFNVYKLLQALATVGILARKEPQASHELSLGAPQQDDFGAFATAGVSDAADAWAMPEPSTSEPGFAWDTAEESPAMNAAAFDDDTPPAPNFSEPAPSIAPPSPAAATPQPAWGAPATPMPTSNRVSTPAPPPILSPEPQWGFDEAQIETARRASVPLSSSDADEPPPMSEVVEKASRPNRWIGALIAAVVIVAVGLAGLAAWNWWEARNAEPAPVAVVQHPKRKKPVVTAQTTTTGTALTGTTATTGSTATIAMTSASMTPPPAASSAPMTSAVPAPAPAPITTSAAPIVAATVVKAQPKASPVKGAPLPKVIAKRNAEGTTTITNTGTASTATTTPSQDAMRSHYDEMAKTFASQATGSYTLQFELVCETSSLTRAVQAGGSSVWFIPTSYRGRSCYRVFWGHYPTKAEAQKAKSEVPKSLGAAGVVVAVPK